MLGVIVGEDSLFWRVSSQRGSSRQTKRQKSGQKSLEVENVENTVMGRSHTGRAGPRSRRRQRCSQREQSKVIDQDGDGVSLARLSVHGTWDPFGKTTGPR